MATQLKTPTDVRAQVSAEEWERRVDLACAYRLVAHHGWDDLIFTHLSVRVPGPEGLPVEKSVRAGLSDGKRIEILDGLAEGDRVLVANGGASAVSKESKSNPLSPMPRRPGGNRRR